MAMTPEEAAVLDDSMNMLNDLVTAIKTDQTATPDPAIVVPTIGGPGGHLDEVDIKPLPWGPEELRDVIQRAEKAIEGQNRNSQYAVVLGRVLESIQQLIPAAAALL